MSLGIPVIPGVFIFLLFCLFSSSRVDAGTASTTLGQASEQKGSPKQFPLYPFTRCAVPPAGSISFPIISLFSSSFSVYGNRFLVHKVQTTKLSLWLVRPSQDLETSWEWIRRCRHFIQASGNRKCLVWREIQSGQYLRWPLGCPPRDEQTQVQ